MKKILTIALCIASVGVAGAQKAAVDQALKLAGKADKLPEARSLVEQASKDPETANDVRTYYAGGKIEFDAYDSALKKRAINPNDPSINPLEMAYELLNGYKAYDKALPFDQLPNEKGQIKPKYTKEMVSKMNGYANDIFNAGGTFYSEKKYYPEAYEAFMIYGELPSKAYADKNVKALPDSVINTAFFNAGLSAYAGNALQSSANAFKAARLNNSNNPQNYIYEIACWQYIASGDSAMQHEAESQIEEIARAGYKKFGISQPLFINNLVNSLVLKNRGEEAIELINEQLFENPNNGALYGLRGFVNDRLDKDEDAIADYRKAASFDDTDFETLKNAAKKIFKTGTEVWNATEGADKATRNQIKEDYFVQAKNIAERAKAINPKDSDINYVLENIDYALETYFSH